MYTKYFGFNEKPFTLTPNPRFIYLSRHHKEAFAHLLYGINNHYGFIELIGEVGAGKTTVLRTLLGQLNEETYRSALIFNPCLTGVELLRSINHEFGLNSTSEYANELLGELNTFLVQENTKGITVVLVIDEAQNLSPEILEQLRLISNLETENDKLIQIILAGQLELSALLELPQLRQLNQRIAVRYRLRTMSFEETCSYIRHRMVVAGETGGVSFSRPAYRLIHLYSHGLPRLINNLCDRALLIAYGDEQRRVSAGIVLRGIKEQLNVTQTRKLYLASAGAVSVVIACLALFFSGGDWRKYRMSSAPAAALSPAGISKASTADSNMKVPMGTLSGAKNPAAERRLVQLQQEFLSSDRNEVNRGAFNAIANQWNVLPMKQLKGHLSLLDMRDRFAANGRNLTVSYVKGTLEEMVRFNLPFIMETKVTGTLGGYCLAVTSVKKDSVSISPLLFGSNELSKNDLNSIASGLFALVWQNRGHIPFKFKTGDKRPDIVSLQLLLKQAGTYKGPADGIYSVATVKAVTDFQQSVGITRDEAVGELTLATLSRYNTNPKAPLISDAEGTR